MSIPEEELRIGHIYRVRARNLLGPSVYAGHGRFFGLREKLGSRFIDTEFLNVEKNRPFNTCTPLEDLGEIPKDVSLESGKPVDRDTRRPVRFDQPKDEGGRGWVFADTDEPSENIWPVLPENKRLRQILELFLEL